MSALRSVAAAAKKLVQVQHASIPVPLNVQVLLHAPLWHLKPQFLVFKQPTVTLRGCSSAPPSPVASSEDDLTAPQVAKQADQLVISGPLGTNRTCLSKLDSLGVAAVRLAPESRSIDLCSPDKEFFGTIQVPGNYLKPATLNISFCSASVIGKLRPVLRQAAGFHAAHGLQSLLKNKIQGVTRGYLVYLRMVGIGYRASLEGQVHSAICV